MSLIEKLMPQWWLAAEAALVAALGWPDWAMRTLAILSCGLLVVSAPQLLAALKSSADDSEDHNEGAPDQYLHVCISI
jgi:hypothetical protein